MDNIIWKPIKINDELTNYEVSNTGLVRNIKTKKLLKLYKHSTGHLYIHLRLGYYKYKTSFPHRLVAQAFIPNPNQYGSIKHIDGNLTNNNVSNLKWTNRCIRTYSIDQIHKVCQLLEQGYRNKDIQKITKVSLFMISFIRNKHSWNQISNKYNIPKPKYNYRQPVEIINKIYHYFELGLSNKEIYKLIDLSKNGPYYLKYIKRKWLKAQRLL